MKVGQLIELLKKFDPETDVMTQKTDFCGNIGEVFSVKESSYSFFGCEIPCILITDDCEDDESETNESEDTE